MATSATNRVDVLLSTTGGVTEADATADAITTGEYTYKPDDGTVMLHRLLIKITDTPNVDTTKYGSGVLTSGLLVTIKNRQDTVIHRFNPRPIVAIDDWGLLAGPDLPETDQSTVIVRWTIEKGSGAVKIHGGDGEYFSVELQEDCTGLASQHFQLQGYRVAGTY